MRIIHTVVFRLRHDEGSPAESAFLSDARRILSVIPTVNEFAVRTKRKPVTDVLEGLLERGILAGPGLGNWYPELADVMLLSTTECTREQEMDALVTALEEVTR